MRGHYSFLFATLMILMVACNSSSNSETSESSNDIVNVDSLKKAVASDIISWGAKDAYFNEDNYFVYCVDPKDLSATANEVAKAMFPNVQEVPGVKGCIVMDFKSKKELGRYEK